MSEFFQQFFEDTCKNVLEKYLFEQANEITYQEVRIDLAEYARLTGVQIELTSAGPRHLCFTTVSQGQKYSYDYIW